MTDRLDACIVAETGTIRDAMQALDAGAGQIALVVDDGGRLVGVVTDGDLRRALLTGATMDSSVLPALNRRFVSVQAGEGRADVLELMRARRIDAIPVLDGDQMPVGLHLLHAFLEPAERTNRAVVMAGGQGARLWPLTETVPKPMLRVAGRPILERIVLHLVGSGISRISISVNYLGHVIEEYFEDGSRFGARIEYLREEQPLGTAGALGLLGESPTEALLLMNGDLVTNADVGGLLDAHVASGAVATIGVRRYLHAVPFGCVERDGDHVVRLEEKPVVEREVNSGIYALAPAAIARVEPGVALSMPDLIGTLLTDGLVVGAFEIEDDWIDVGQREQLDRARTGG